MLVCSKKIRKPREKPTIARKRVNKLKQMTAGKFCEWKPGMGNNSGRSLLIRGYAEKRSFVTCITLSFGILMQPILICPWRESYHCRLPWSNSMIFEKLPSTKGFSLQSLLAMSKINRCLSCRNTHAANGTAYPKNGMKNPATTGKVFMRSFLVCGRMGKNIRNFHMFQCSGLPCAITNMF